MRFGVATFLTDETIRPVPLGRALEDRGFDSVWLGEHSHLPAAREGRPAMIGRQHSRMLDPFLTLASIASVTENLLLGTGVALLIQRDVIHTAKEVASLDLISGGRALLGVGAGWNRQEMLNHGTDPRTRGALLNEQLEALKTIWTQDEPAYEGEYVRFGPILQWPKPVRKPHTPIYVGGESPAALDRLRQHADGWLPRGNTSVEEIKRVRKWLDDNGRSDVRFTLFGAPADKGALGEYAEAGIERVAFMLNPVPEAQALAKLDEFASFAAQYR
ncbi:LLM class F420-dependent oxidoreductase [Amycolatopsis pithecellobii]|uniref:TIGR03619 family F420-dependent LLM class oxidoreductase n=1 Tax=Amycolatopsis pithecellobii TaxID=664692 RepID=A0A6N7ZB65_9PSEU|nr:LLM class F420-dependent oxidoreductase [Amycolatopsis pithecellobii]MTD58967.1 TIGR03619 family F420-dependent LLM class oxidoreductase [Amycolatopsis pithecellobii]